MTVPPVVFADASFYIALLSRKDRHHQRALRWQRLLRRESIRVVTSDAVLWEWLTFFAEPSTRSIAFTGYQRLQRDPAVEIIGFDPPLCAAATNVYGARPDKSWGVIDCLSFVVMQQRSLTAALSTDHHFEQAGFSALLLHDPPH